MPMTLIKKQRSVQWVRGKKNAYCLAKLMMADLNVWFQVDDPTNHMDMEAIESAE